MTLAEIIEDIHAMQADMLMYERKYGILTATFYESYLQGDEPPNDAWVMDWNGWAATYEVWLRRHQQYDQFPAPSSYSRASVESSTPQAHPS